MPDGTVQGRVYFIDDTRTYGRNGTFQKRLIVIEQDRGRYGNLVPLELIQDDCTKADGLNHGDEIKASFACSGREWKRDDQSEPRYFVNLEVSAIQLVKSVQPAQQQTPPPAPAQAPPQHQPQPNRQGQQPPPQQQQAPQQKPPPPDDEIPF